MVHVYCTDSVVVDYKIHIVYRVVHFGIQLPGLSRIQAESDKNRIHTHGHVY